MLPEPERLHFRMPRSKDELVEFVKPYCKDVDGMNLDELRHEASKVRDQARLRNDWAAEDEVKEKFDV